MLDPNIGKKVSILFPNKQLYIRRVLKEDYQGLFVDFNKQKLRVEPKLNAFGENNTNSYIVKKN